MRFRGRLPHRRGLSAIYSQSALAALGLSPGGGLGGGRKGTAGWSVERNPGSKSARRKVDGVGHPLAQPPRRKEKTRARPPRLARIIFIPHHGFTPVVRDLSKTSQKSF